MHLKYLFQHLFNSCLKRILKFTVKPHPTQKNPLMHMQERQEKGKKNHEKKNILYQL